MDAVRLCMGCSRPLAKPYDYPFPSCSVQCPLADRARRHHEAKLSPEERLKALLNKYGKHLGGCARDSMKVFRAANEGKTVNDLPPCSCGFDEARK